MVGFGGSRKESRVSSRGKQGVRGFDLHFIVVSCFHVFHCLFICLLLNCESPVFFYIA